MSDLVPDATEKVFYTLDCYPPGTQCAHCNCHESYYWHYAKESSFYHGFEPRSEDK